VRCFVYSVYQGTEVCGGVGKQVHNPVNELGVLSTVIGQLSLENSLVHTCGERVEVRWTTGSSANE
jgi:hypothetical protein